MESDIFGSRPPVIRRRVCAKAKIPTHRWSSASRSHKNSSEIVPGKRYEVLSVFGEDGGVCSRACQAREACPAKRRRGQSGQRGSLTRDLCLIVDGVADAGDGTIMRHFPQPRLLDSETSSVLSHERLADYSNVSIR